jgi:hypothetical protein
MPPASRHADCSSIATPPDRVRGRASAALASRLSTSSRGASRLLAALGAFAISILLKVDRFSPRSARMLDSGRGKFLNTAPARAIEPGNTRW